MGARESLLAGAKQCLYERGYAHTTVRDVVDASGTNLASIGYHFGSKDKLMTTALLEAFEDWNARVSAYAFNFGDGDPFEEIESAWHNLLQMFAAERPLMVANIEVMTQAQHEPQLREQLAAAYERVRVSFTDKLRELLGDTPSDEATRAAVSFYTALGDGLMIQWLLDPENTPTARELTTALRAIVTAFSRHQD